MMKQRPGVKPSGLCCLLGCEVFDYSVFTPGDHKIIPANGVVNVVTAFLE